jgi:hypothetical protein
MKRSTKIILALAIPIGVIAIIILALIGLAYTSTKATCEEMLSQLKANKDKIYTWGLQIDQEKLAYSKEWFPTSAETDQLNSEINAFNQASHSLDNVTDSYNNQCARSP